MKVSPFVIFIARDHHFDNELFSKKMKMIL